MNKIKSLLVACLIAGISVIGCKKNEGPTAPSKPDPIASFTYSGQTVSPATISFQNTSQNANKFLWEFGDGTTSTQTSPTKIYSAAGTFTVKLTASDSTTGKSSSTSQQISILPGPVAGFSYAGLTVTGATITFQNSSLNANSYSWDFGDGTTSTAVNPTKTYSTQGTYTVRLTATNTSYNRSDVATRQIQITPSSVFIDRVYVDNIPFVDAFGAGWDLLSGPDLFFNLVDSVSTVLYSTQSSYYLDLTPTSLPVSWTLNPSYQIMNWSKALYIGLLDWDGITSNDFIGYTSGFRINTVIAQLGYVTTLSLQNASGTIRVRLILRWQ